MLGSGFHTFTQRSFPAWTNLCVYDTHPHFRHVLDRTQNYPHTQGSTPILHPSGWHGEDKFFQEAERPLDWSINMRRPEVLHPSFWASWMSHTHHVLVLLHTMPTLRHLTWVSDFWWQLFLTSVSPWMIMIIRRFGALSLQPSYWRAGCSTSLFAGHLPCTASKWQWKKYRKYQLLSQE